MGFFNGLGKMLQGKPVFEDPASGSGGEVSDHLTTSSNTPQTTGEDGQKIIPTIRLEHVKSTVNGDKMEVTAWVTNESPLSIELDKVTMMKQRTEIDRHLAPEQAYQVVLYRGEQMANEHEHHAQLQYKIVHNGDYFRADYTIRYQRLSTGKFVVEYLTPERHIRDI